MTNEETAVKATFGIIGNACLALIKGTAGFLIYALIADAIESTIFFASFFSVIWN
jgi:divalent metal cation (Fe/Co/Zn/Cd) transporter